MSMNKGMGLDQLDDRPELTVAIGGREYHFSELPIGKLADIQAFIRRAVPNPLDAIKPHLEGLSDADRAVLLRDAREEARHWPPQAGTSAGMAAMMASEPGQVEALYLGLSVHQPEITRDDARAVYRQLTREAVRAAKAAKKAGRKDDDGEGTVGRIFSVLFGFGDPLLSEELPLPEGSAPDRSLSIGGDSTRPASDGYACANGRSAATRSLNC